ncbi:MAG: small subunit ribosomal protein [Actinomycetota bacterium]|nr:small subunit ribosomal protein [Actinomycetota bacterium]
MAVKIRLKRMGKIRAPYYRIVVADSRTKRDGRVIEEIGKYHPTEEPSFIEVQSERALYWLGVGAQPSPQVEAILKLTGDWGIFKGDKNAKSTVKYKEAKVEFQADEKKKPVLKPKSEKPAPKAEEPAAEAETAAVAEPVEVPVATVPVDSGAVEADAAADQVRAEEADESTTTTVETPEQVDNSDAPAAAAAEPEATDAEAVAEAAAEPVEAVAEETPAEA